MIRFIREDEMDKLIGLCEKQAAYERASYEENGKKEALSEAIFSDNPKLFCLVAKERGEIVGYATYMFQYSTWEASYYTYLDCLYLLKKARGRDIGKDLMNKVKEESLNNKISLMQWQTPDFNVDAIRFYRRLGGVSKFKERFSWELS